MRVAVLGPLEVHTDDGASLTVPGAKERLLLAILTAGSPGVVSFDALAESLWNSDLQRGGLPPVAGRLPQEVGVVGVGEDDEVAHLADGSRERLLARPRSFAGWADATDDPAIAIPAAVTRTPTAGAVRWLRILDISSPAVDTGWISATPRVQEEPATDRLCTAAARATGSRGQDEKAPGTWRYPGTCR